MIQQNNQEFFQVLLKDISKELNKSSNQTNHNLIEFSRNQKKSDMEKFYNNNFNEKENSLISDIFYCVIIDCNTCRYKYENFIFEKLTDIPLKIYNNEEIELLNLIKSYFSSIYVEYIEAC